MSAIPETCGACPHMTPPPGEEGPAFCYHPDRPLLTLQLPRAAVAPPRICPLRRAEEIRAAREAGQVEGATWMQEEARTAACPVRALIPAAVCARARAKRVP